MRYLLVMAIVLNLIGCGSQGVNPLTGNAANAATVNIVALGDSNTDPAMAASTGGGSPWLTYLQSGLSSAYPSTTYTITNKGVSGQSSAGLITALATQFSGLHPDIICIMTGTNDSYLLGYTVNGRSITDYATPGIQLTTPNDINVYDGVGSYGSSNQDGDSYGTTPYWPTILAWIRANVTTSTGKVPLIVAMTPPPAASYPGDLGATVSGGSVADYAHMRPTRNLTAMQSKLQDYAIANGLVLADIYAEVSGHSSWLANAIYDGVHLNATGRQYAANRVLSALAPYLDSNGVVASASHRIAASGGRIAASGRIASGN